MMSIQVVALLTFIFLLEKCISTRPLPNLRQSEFADYKLTQFMHFGIPTFWDGPINVTYHDCKTTAPFLNKTAPYYPCLDPKIFNPVDLNATQWVLSAKKMGIKQICLTAQHEGGFALWPSNFTKYGVSSSSYKDGNGDILKEFSDACNEHGIKICYYLNIMNNMYFTFAEKLGAKEYMERELGMLREVVENYGPVDRFWFDGTHHTPTGLDVNEMWKQAYEIIRQKSPDTMISSYRGDVCAAKDGSSIYTNDGPPPNTTDINKCGKQTEEGKYFHPTEMHGAVMQEGPTGGDIGGLPTYWFWHREIGHQNASNMFKIYQFSVGRGSVLLTNIPPNRTGLLPEEYIQVMEDVGQAIHDTYEKNVGVQYDIVDKCADINKQIIHLNQSVDFDWIVTKENINEYGQRIANYSIDARVKDSEEWQNIVPPPHKKTDFTDRPDGSDPKDGFIGYQRFDNLTVDSTEQFDAIRFNCIRTLEDPVYIKEISLHKVTAPWIKDEQIYE